MDTSLLIKDAQDLFRSRSVACLLENDQLHLMIKSSPVKNILSKIYNEKTSLLKHNMVEERSLFETDKCLITRDYKMTQLVSSDVVLIGERHTADLLMATLEGLGGVFNKMWISDKIIFEYNLVSYYNGDKPEIARE